MGNLKNSYLSKYAWKSKPPSTPPPWWLLQRFITYNVFLSFFWITKWLCQCKCPKICEVTMSQIMHNSCVYRVSLIEGMLSKIYLYDSNLLKSLFSCFKETVLNWQKLKGFWPLMLFQGKCPRQQHKKGTDYRLYFLKN